jgi:uncharacterized protein YdiU (UPF0061 family)
MEGYDPAAVFSSIDHGGRYAYVNQAPIARWNLARFAETLLPLMAEAGDEAAAQRALDDALAVIDAFPDLHADALWQGRRAKLGLLPAGAADEPGDRALADDWLAMLQAQSVDFTLAWRRLADAADDDRGSALRALFPEPAAFDGWLVRWRARCAQDDAAGGPGAVQRATLMRRASPWIIPRNQRVEEALAAASDDDDLGPFERLLAAIRRPWDEVTSSAPYAEPAPPEITAGYRTFCGT